MRIQHQIVVIDDDPNILRLVETVLVSEGHAVKTTESGSEGTGMALDPSTDLVLLDLNLPDTDGIDIARLVRANSDVPILMLTSRADVASRIVGLDAGADDYLAKPFNLDELCARVGSLLRRAGMISESPDQSDGKPSIRGWCVDTESLEIVGDDGRRVAVTERELMIMMTLMRRAGSVITRDELQRQTAGRKWQTDDRSLDVHVSRLRKKLKQVADGPSPIKTVRGRGFLIEGDE